MEMIQVLPQPEVAVVYPMSRKPVYPADKDLLPGIPCVVIDTSTRIMYYCTDSEVRPMASVWG